METCSHVPPPCHCTDPIASVQPEGQEEHGAPGERAMRIDRAGEICGDDVGGDGVRRGQIILMLLVVALTVFLKLANPASFSFSC